MKVYNKNLKRNKIAHFVFLLFALIALCGTAFAKDTRENTSLNQNTNYEKQWKSAYSENIKQLDTAAVDSIKKISPLLIQEMKGEVLPAKLNAGVAEKRFCSEPETVFFIELSGIENLKSKLQSEKSRGEKITKAAEILKSHAETSQASIIKYLQKLKANGIVKSWQPFWLTNQIAVEGKYQAVFSLALHDEVKCLRANRALSQTEPPANINTTAKIKSAKSQDSAAANSTEKTKKENFTKGNLSPDNWNIDKVDADRVWSELGKTGEGVVVGIIDSGVDWQHPALLSRYRGYDEGTTQTQINHSRNWFEFDGALYPGGDYGATMSAAPIDPIEPYSGTFHLGIILGQEDNSNRKIGLAPGAKWTACKPKLLNASQNITDDVTLLKCFQYFLAPTNQTGALSSADATKAPHVINCSFSGTIGADSTFTDAIKNLTDAGIIVVAAAGDTGKAGGILYPASLPETIAAAASDKNDDIWEFSSRGPSFWSESKPDITAPGVNILSTIPVAAGSYESGRSGTGIAAAHITGAIALILSVNPNLSSEEVYFSLMNTALDLGSPGFDKIFGYGRLNAFDAAKLIADNAELNGSIYNAAASTTKIPGAVITGKSLSSGIVKFRVTSDASGNYTLHGPEGEFEITVTAFGYDAYIFPRIHLFKNIHSRLDFPMTKQAQYTLQGTIRDKNTNAALVAKVHVVETGSSVTTGYDGKYSFALPKGTYTVKASVVGHRIISQTAQLTMNKTLDFKLPTIPSIFLINADRYFGWLYGWSAVNYYQKALDNYGYSYDYHEIEGSWNIPELEELQKYNIIFWIQGTGSPTSIGASSMLESYLSGGGKLILCGEDIARLEDGKNLDTNFLKYDFISENVLASGVKGSNILTGLEMSFEGDYVAAKGTGTKTSFKPDAIIPTDASSVPILYFTGIETYAAAIRTLPCGSATFRAVLLSIGIESIAPIEKHGEILDKIITWISASSSANSFAVSPGNSSGNGIMRSTYVYEQTIVNTGTSPDSYKFSASMNSWSVAVVDPLTGLQISQTQTLNPCEKKDIQLQIGIPGDIALLTTDTAHLKISSANQPAVEQTLEFVTTAFIDWQEDFEWENSRYGLAVSSAGDCDVYIFGGLNSMTNHVESATLKYSAGSDKLEEVSSMPIPAAHIQAVNINGRIYLPGGYNPDKDPSTIDALTIYDPANDNFYYGRTLPIGLQGAAAAAANGKLFIFGGDTISGEFSDKTFMYDPQTDQWTEKSPMPGGARAYISAAELNGKIYVAGGYPDLSTVEEYDPENDTWKTMSPMNYARRSFSLIAAENSIYAIGGADREWNSITSAERFTPASNIWKNLYPLKHTARAGAGAALYQGNIIVVGGVGESGAIKNEILPLSNYPEASSIEITPQTITTSDILTIKLKLTNAGAKNANSVSISSPVPDICEYVPNSATGGLSYSAQDNQMIWSGNLSSNTTLELTYQAAITNPVASAVEVPVLLYINSSCGVKLISDSFQIDGPLLTSCKKTVSKLLAHPGDNMQYVITMINKSLSKDANLVLADTIPTNTTYAAGTVTGGASYNSSQNKITWNGTLAAATSGNPKITIKDSDTGGEPFSWEDISGSGTSIPLSMLDDDGAFIPVGFTFNWFGINYTEVGVSTNGYIKFGGKLSELRNSDNRLLPQESAPFHNIAAVFWDDLKIVTAQGDMIKYETKGAEPSRRLIIQWRAHHFSDTNAQNTAFLFQAVLYENSSLIKYYYMLSDSENGDGISATTGIENSDGKYGSSYLFNGTPEDNLIHNNLAIGITQQAGITYASRIITFNVNTNSGISCGTEIINTANILESVTNIEYPITASTMIDSADFSASQMSAGYAVQEAKRKIPYTVTIKNTGNFAADVSYINPIPAECDYDSGLTNGATYNSAQKQIEWTKNIAANAVETIEFNLKIKEETADGIIINNVGHITSPCGKLFDISASTEVESYDFSSSIFLLSKSEAVKNEKISGSIYVVNSGGAETWGHLEFPFPAHLSYVINSAAASVGTVSYNSSQKKLLWDFTIAGHEMLSVTFEGLISSSAQTGVQLEQKAVVYYPPGSVDAISYIKVAAPDISQSTFNIHETYCAPSSILNHTLTVKNTSIAPSTFLYVSAALSANEDYVQGSATNGLGYDASHALNYIGSIGALSTKVFTYQTKVKHSAPHNAKITNDVTIATSDRQIILSDFSTNLAPAVSAAKTVNMQKAEWLDILEYEINLTNTGAAQANVTVEDILPPETTFVENSLTPSSGSASYDSDSGAINFNALIDTGKSVKLKYAAQITSRTLTEYIENIATITENNTGTSQQTSARTDLKWVYTFDWGKDDWLVYSQANIFPSVKLGKIGFDFNTNINAFGFWGTPFNTIDWIPGKIYRGKFTVSTTVSEKPKVPAFRLRSSTQNFQLGTSLVVNSIPEAESSPGISGTEYNIYFNPPQKGMDANPFLVYNFDLLAYDSSDAKTGSIFLEELEITRYDESELVVSPQITNQFTFNAGNENWVFFSPAKFTAPEKLEGNGYIGLKSTNNISTFGMWQAQLDSVNVTPGKLYRGTFKISSDQTDRSVVPGFRVRLNSLNLQLIQLLDVNSNGAGDISPLSTPENYQIYFQPQQLEASDPNNHFSPAFDIINITPADSPDASLFLDEVIIEEFNPPAE